MDELRAVDYWCNAFLPDRLPRWKESILEQGVPLKIEREGDTFVAATEMLERMDAIGMQTLVLPVSDLPDDADALDFETFAWRIEEIEELHAMAPERFVGQWSINPGEAMEGVERAAEALSTEWCRGLHIHTHSFDRRFDDADYYPFYALASDEEVPVVMQAGTSGGLFPSECGRPVGIDRPALFFSGVDFVLSHTGWPWVDEAVAMAMKFPNVYLGTATFPPKRWPAAVLDFARGIGRRKLLFGTGFPLVGHTQGLGQLRELGLSEEATLGIAGENARDVFAGIDG